MKKLIFVFIILQTIILSACNIADSNIQDKIVSPENKTTPIQGKWVIEEKIDTRESKKVSDEIIADEEGVDNYIGREVLFSKDAIVVADDYANNPTFKFKNVNTNDYLLYKYKINPKNLDILSETVQVITSLKNEQLFYEFVSYDEDSLLIFINDSFYELSKIADEVSDEEVNRYINIESNMMITLDTMEVEDIKSGVLFGIKTPIYDEGNEIPDWDYKTIWIRSDNRNISKYQLDELLVPRKSGFWIVNVDRNETDSSINDKIVAIPQFTRTDMKEAREELDKAMGRLGNEPIALNIDRPIILKDILFVGNDYISVEKTEVNNSNRKTLEIYTLDNIEEQRPIKLSDIIEDGEFLFKEGSENIQSLGENVALNQSNIGLARRNGYWSLKGRINYSQNEEELYKDFNIKAIPPKAMVSYDELDVSWDAINDQFPEATDIFSSPNGKFIIVVTKNELHIYPSENGEILSFEPMTKIQIPNNASIIMSEWALGRYPEIWENEMIKHGAQNIE